MPSTSKKQHNFMAAIAHGWKPSSGKGPSAAVAKHFLEADKGKKFKSGGEMKETKSMAKAEMAALKRGKAPADVMEYEREEHKSKGFRKGGMARKPAPRRRAAMAAPDMSKMGGMGLGGMGMGMGMARGGSVSAPTKKPMVENMITRKTTKHGDGAAVRGKTRAKPVKMARGGGIESRGKTRGKMC